MANILYRGSSTTPGTNTAGAKSAPLTNDEIDKNLYALNIGKVETSDSRLSDSRPASDVYAWAKAATKPSYALNEISSAALSATTGSFSSTISASNLSGTNTGDETATTIRTKLGITTLSGSNTGDETATTIRTKLGITTLSGSNTGDQIIPTTLPHNGTALSATTGTFSSDVSVTGAISATGNITSTSDARVKTNLEKITDAISKVSQLNGYTFDRTDIETTRQTGVIAQEVLKVLPEAITGNADAYSVAYGNMMGLMIEAIKELNMKVEDLQNQLANK